MIDVRVPDAPAVLYRLSAALAGYGLDIRSAKVATLGHEVVDVFYVQRGGRPPRQLTPAECDEVRAQLRTAVAADAAWQPSIAVGSAAARTARRRSGRPSRIVRPARA